MNGRTLSKQILASEERAIVTNNIRSTCLSSKKFYTYYNFCPTCVFQKLQNKIDEENRANAEIESYLRAHTTVSNAKRLHSVKIHSFLPFFVCFENVHALFGYHWQIHWTSVLVEKIHI